MPPDLRDPNEPIGQLSPQDWLSAPPARMVLAALSAGGADVRFVGGCVRDAVLRRPVHDIDIGTPEEPGPVMRRLAEAGIKTIPTGLEHGTVTAIVEGQSFEITSLRDHAPIQLEKNGLLPESSMASAVTAQPVSRQPVSR